MKKYFNQKTNKGEKLPSAITKTVVIIKKINILFIFSLLHLSTFLSV